MQKILHALRPLVILNTRHPCIVLLVALLLAIISARFALRLQIDTDLATLLPDCNTHVQALKELQRTVGGETVMEVASRSSSFEANMEFAEDLIAQILAPYDTERNRFFF